MKKKYLKWCRSKKTKTFAGSKKPLKTSKIDFQKRQKYRNFAAL
jgi:hypothetical protein